VLTYVPWLATKGLVAGIGDGRPEQIDYCVTVCFSTQKLPVCRMPTTQGQSLVGFGMFGACKL